MFTARFRMYWNDFISEYVEIRTNSINEILEYAYKVHKDSLQIKSQAYFDEH